MPVSFHQAFNYKKFGAECWSGFKKELMASIPGVFTRHRCHVLHSFAEYAMARPDTAAVVCFLTPLACCIFTSTPCGLGHCDRLNRNVTVNYICPISCLGGHNCFVRLLLLIMSQQSMKYGGLCLHRRSQPYMNNYIGACALLYRYWL